MHNNYERLFHELSELLEDEDVRDNLDEKLRDRINQLVHEKGEAVSKHVCRTEKSLPKTSEDMCHKFDKISLKEGSHRQKMSAKLSSESRKMKNSKRSESKFRNERSSERINSN